MKNVVLLFFDVNQRSFIVKLGNTGLSNSNCERCNKKNILDAAYEYNLVTQQPKHSWDFMFIVYRRIYGFWDANYLSCTLSTIQLKYWYMLIGYDNLFPSKRRRRGEQMLQTRSHNILVDKVYKCLSFAIVCRYQINFNKQATV